MADPMARQDETRAALSDPVYAAAFEAMARGGRDALDEQARAAIARARELTGTTPPGLPMPMLAAPSSAPSATPPASPTVEETTP